MMEKDFYIGNMNNIAWVKILLYLPTWKMPEFRPKEVYTDDVTLPRFNLPEGSLAKTL